MAGLQGVFVPSLSPSSGRGNIPDTSWTRCAGRAARMRSSGEALRSGDLDDRGALGDQQADEAVPQVVGAHALFAGGANGGGEDPMAPVLDAVKRPRRAVGRGEDEVG